MGDRTERAPKTHSGLVGRLRRTGALVWRAVRIFVAAQVLTHSAAIAFYTVLSLAPILVLLLWLSSGLGSEMQARLVEHLSGLIGFEGAEVVETVVEHAERRIDTGNIAGWLSVGAIAVSATGVFAQLQIALNAVWNVQKRREGIGIVAWLRKRLLSLGLILSLGFLLLVSLVLSSALSAAMLTVRGTVPDTYWLWSLTDFVIPLGVYFLLFMALFRYVPDVRLRWRHVAFGSLVTALLFVLGKWLLALYLGTSALGSTYGAAGSLVLMLVWTYYSAAIVLFGAAVTHARVADAGERVPTEKFAEPAHDPRTGELAKDVVRSSA